MSDNIVADWLKSIGLECFTQAFLDNGYDELEVCKQIGELDLDAIGVSKGIHRKRILQAAVKLKEEGGTSVYFTLESQEPASTDSSVSDNIPTNASGLNIEESTHKNEREQEESDSVVFPPTQLRMILRDKLLADGIDLLTPPYTRRDWTGCKHSLMNLAAKYAIELNTDSTDIVERLEEIRQWMLQKDSELFYSAATITPVRTASGNQNIGTSRNSPHHINHVVPPALPSCPPPCISHIDSTKSMDLHSISSRSDTGSLYYSNYATIDSGICCVPLMTNKDFLDVDKKKTSALGRFFRNMGIRRSGRKQYKQYDGDPLASDITMSDDDRISLMLMVKEGKLTTEQALLMVKQFEDERRKESQQQIDRRNAQKKKKQAGKPVKSPSAIYAESTRQCEVCQRLVSYDQNHSISNTCCDPSHRFECFQHRRVHSVSHIDFANSPQSPETARAMSCTPTHHLYGQSDVKSPVTFYSPGHHTCVYSPSSAGPLGRGGYGVYFQGGEYYPENVTKTTVRVHESPSRTSSLSAESEQSMECQTHSLTHAEMAAMRGDNLNYGSNSSAMSVGSDTSPSWRKNMDAEEMLQIQKSRYPSGTTKSVSSVESSQSASSGMSGSFHSPSPGSGKIIYPVEDISPNSQDIYSPSLVRVHTEYHPAKSEIDMLDLKKGDIIWVANKSAGGLWKGVINGKSGWFKPSHTEPCSHIVEQSSLQRKSSMHRRVQRKTRPKNVTELLQRIGLEDLESLFIQNGFDHLESFADLNEDDLNALRIFEPQQRAKLLTAAELLHLEDSKVEESTPVVSSNYQYHIPVCYSPRMVLTGEYHHTRACPASRDSGCYGSWEHLGHRDAHNKMVNTAIPKLQNGLDRTLSPLHSNKENLHPNKYDVDTRYCRQTNSSGRGSASSGRASVETCHNFGEQRSLDIERIDKEYTEEDREVCEIISVAHKQEEDCNFASQNTPLSSPNVDCGNQSIIMCSYAGTQTSPHYGYVCDHEENQRYSLHKDQRSVQNKGATNLADQKSQPFPRKTVPKMGSSSRDAQVQVMCPMSSSMTVREDVFRTSKQDSVQYQKQYDIPVSQPQYVNYDARKLSSPVINRTPVVQNGVTHPNPLVQYDKKVPNSRSTSLDRATKKPIPAPRDLKQVTKSLITMVTSKLANEKIDLSQEPYSTKSGQCGIPSLLIQRYSEELKSDVPSICLVLDQVRIHTLSSLNRFAVPAENLAQKCSVGCDLKMTSIPDFFTSIGLPMYIHNMLSQDLTSPEQILQLTNQEIHILTGATHKHLKRITHALNWLRNKMAKQANTGETTLIDRV